MRFFFFKFKVSIEIGTVNGQIKQGHVNQTIELPICIFVTFYIICYTKVNLFVIKP
jgi:hypothetical protein